MPNVKNGIWGGPRLFIPTVMEALVIGKPNQGFVPDAGQEGSWANLQNKYQELQYPSSINSVIPAPFSYSQNLPDVGVHLFWALPAAFRRARTPGESGVAATVAPGSDFPLIPNRWMVMRLAVDASDVKGIPQVDAWVLQSDAEQEGGQSFPQGTAGEQAGLEKIIYIGRKVELADFAEPGGNMFLTAPGPGDLTFTAVYDNMKNILAFQDDLSKENNNLLLSYAVFGWFSDPQQDPLYGPTPGTAFTSEDEWASMLETLQWSIDDDVDGAVQDWLLWAKNNGLSPDTQKPQQVYASQTLVHAFVEGIQWQGPEKSYPPAPIMNGSIPEVAVGATPVEAIAAWVESKSDVGADGQIEDALVALQQDMIFDYEKDPVAFEIKAHEARFSKQSGGTDWIVKRAEMAEDAKTGGSATIPLSPEQSSLLTALNSQQADLDDQNERLARAQSNLLNYGWMFDHTFPSSSDRKTVVAQIQKLQGEISTLKDKITATTTAIADQSTALQSALGDDYVLTTADRISFTGPQDISVLVAGASVDDRLGDASVFDTPNAVPGRFTGQTITALDIATGTEGKSIPEISVTIGDVGKRVKLPTGKDIPKETSSFWLECIMLNPACAPMIADIAITKAPSLQQYRDELITEIQGKQSLWKAASGDSNLNARLLSLVNGWEGLLPDKISCLPWAQPWCPLYVMWEAEFHPSADTPDAAMLKDWQLGDIDYTWTGKKVTPKAVTYAGRTIINRSTVTGFTEKLNAFVNDSAMMDRITQETRTYLQDTAHYLQDADLIAQSLGSLQDSFVMLKQDVNVDSQAIANDKLPGNIDNAIPWPDVKQFYPLRAGHISFTKMWVVDAYGQILRVTRGNNSPLRPFRAQSVTTAKRDDSDNTQFIQLTPRIAQPMRTDMAYLSASSDTIPTSSADDTSPICGWVMHNHLNRSLMVLDAAGQLYGEVLMTETDNDQRALRWDAAPGRDVPLGSPPNLPNAHLDRMINGLLAQSVVQGADVLNDLLNVIDQTLWTVDPQSGARDDNLAILVGRPLAVVRASITLDLSGPPLYSQSWDAIGQDKTGGFEATEMTAYIGDVAYSQNGAMGFYLDDDYSVFRPLKGYSPKAFAAAAQAVARAPVRQYENGYLTKYIAADPAITLTADRTHKRLLTIIQDPQGWVPALTGVTPQRYLALPPGPVQLAEKNMTIAVRTGPILTDPDRVQMPLPAAIRGQWDWAQKAGVSLWAEDQPLQPADSTAKLPTNPSILREGWIKLGNSM